MKNLSQDAKDFLMIMSFPAIFILFVSVLLAVITLSEEDEFKTECVARETTAVSRGDQFQVIYAPECK